MTELAHLEESSLTILPPAQPPSLAARQMLLAHAEMMQTAYQLAENMCRTKLVPLRFQGKPQEGTAAILYGAELGLNPIQSLQRVVPIHGMPTLEARTMVALLKSRGYKVKTVAQSDESVTVWGRDLEGDEHTSTWTLERATNAQYVPKPSSPDSLCRPDVDDDWVTVTKTWDGKTKKSVLGNMKYITDPQAMLKAKAQAEVCRDMAPDVLIGISYTSEELQSERFDERPAPETPARAAPITVEEIFNAPEQPGAAGDPGQDGGNDATQEAAPSGASPITESRDQDDPAPDGPEHPESPQEQPSPRDQIKFSAADRRKGLNMMFALFKDADIAKDNREDRLIIINAIIGEAVESSNDLSDPQLFQLVSQLREWKENGALGDQVTEILNRHALAEDAETSTPEPE